MIGKGEAARLAITNVGLIAAVLLPSLLLFAAVEATLRGAEYSKDPFYMMIVLYVSALPPLALGGLLYQGALLLLPASWSHFRRRVSAIVLSPMVPGLMFVFRLPPYLLFVPLSALSLLLLSSLVYGLTVRLPSPDKAKARAGTPAPETASGVAGR